MTKSAEKVQTGQAILFPKEEKDTGRSGPLSRCSMRQKKMDPKLSSNYFRQSNNFISLIVPGFQDDKIMSQPLKTKPPVS